MLPPRLIWMSAVAAVLVACDGSASKDDTETLDPEGVMPGDCSDGVDNDEDGLVDCDDDGCSGSPDCPSSEEGSEELAAVLQVMEDNCTACHSGSAAAVGLDLAPDRFCESVLDGRLVIPGNAAGSLLQQRIEGDPSSMPPTGLMEEANIEAVALWIDAGAYCEGGGDGGGGGDEDGGGTSDEPDGASIFAGSCAGCHGANGEGISAPAMTDAVAGLSAADVADIAMSGSGSMPPILSDADEAAAVGEYCVAEFGG